MRRRNIVLYVLAVIIQACALPPVLAVQEPQPTIVTSTMPTLLVDQSATKALASTDAPVTPFTAPTATSILKKFSLTPTPTLATCIQAGGRVEVYEITTILLPDPLVYRIYLPPCYDEKPGHFYPVLYLIHGQTYDDTQWERLGAPEAADTLIRSGKVVPFIIVMPRDRVWLEPTEDNFGKAVEQTLVPWVDTHYRTLAEREYRAIGGLSRGGAWAVDIGLARWDLFSAVGVHSGFVFYSDTQPISQWIRNTPAGMMPRIYMDVGDDDSPEIMDGAVWLESLLTNLDIPHEWHMFSGEHVEAYWHAHIQDYLRWYSMDWGK